MKRFLVWALAASLVFVPTAPAYAQEQKPRLRSFTDPTIVVKSTDEMADLILKCGTDETPWRLSCDKLVEEFNKLGRYEPVKNAKELAEFFREETRLGSCGVTTEVEISGVRGDDVEYFKRELSASEPCFGHTATGTQVASAICYQFIKTRVPMYFSRTTEATGTASPPAPEPPTLPPSPSTPGTFGKEEGLVLPPQNPQVRRNGDDRSFIERHWKKAALGAGLLTLAALALVPRQSQEQWIEIDGRRVRTSR